MGEILSKRGYNDAWDNDAGSNHAIHVGNYAKEYKLKHKRIASVKTVDEGYDSTLFQLQRQNQRCLPSPIEKN